MTVSEAERRWAMIACLGTIFLGPIAPIVVWLGEGRRSRFVRRYLVQSLNVILTLLVYAVCLLIVTGLLSLASTTVALTLMSIVLAAGWLFLVTEMIRCSNAASVGAFRDAPHWAYASFVKQIDP
jgi:uncharacterized Tic20 family protein